MQKGAMQVLGEEHSTQRGSFANSLSMLSLALLSRAYVMLESFLRTAAVWGGGEAGPWHCPDLSLNSNAPLSSWVTRGEFLTSLRLKLPICETGIQKFSLSQGSGEG